MATTIFVTKESQAKASTYYIEDAHYLYMKSGIAFLIEDGIVKERGDV